MGNFGFQEILVLAIIIGAIIFILALPRIIYKAGYKSGYKQGRLDELTRNKTNSSEAN